MSRLECQGHCIGYYLKPTLFQVQMATLILFQGYLKSKNDVRELADSVFRVCTTADRTSKKRMNLDRHVWYDLATGKKERNIYITPLPFLQRAVHKSNHNELPFCVTPIHEELYNSLQIPEEIEKQLNKKTAVFLMSGTLYLIIKERPEGTVPKKEELWVPPKDINLIYDDQVTGEALGVNRVCYIDFILSDLKFVSEYKGYLKTPGKKPSLFEFVLNRNPMAKQVWNEFKETFLDAEVS